MADVGQIAYEAYAASVGNMPAWDKLHDRIKDAWRDAANAVLKIAR